MQQSRYTYELKEHSGRKVLAITDLNKDSMSVTNNIERVIKEIELKEKIDSRDFIVVYRDSEGIWDGWNPYSKHFLPLNAETWPQAVDKWMSTQFDYHSKRRTHAN